MQTKLEKLPHSRVKLTVTVEGEKLGKYYDLAIAKVGQYVEVKGFRKGHAPKPLIIQKAGKASIMQEFLDIAVPESYYQAVKEQKDLVPVAEPSVNVKDLKGLEDEEGAPTELVFEAEVDVMPEVTVGDYKKIKVKPKQVPNEIDAKEIEKTIDEIKKIYGPKGDPLGRDYLKAGNFKDDAAMKQAVEENIRQQKVFQAQSDTYDLIIEEVLKKTKVDVPEAFVHNEIHRMERQIEMQAKAYGMTFDDWLKQENKTHDDIHKEWHDQAEKAAKVGMALGKIAELEGIDPTKNDASRLVLEKLHEYAVGK